MTINQLLHQYDTEVVDTLSTLDQLMDLVSSDLRSYIREHELTDQEAIELIREAQKHIEPNDEELTYGERFNPAKAAASNVAKQVGGTHYSDKSIQPIEYINSNNLGFHQGNIVKYITRYKQKNGVEDLEKALWYLDDLIKLEKSKENQ